MRVILIIKKTPYIKAFNSIIVKEIQCISLGPHPSTAFNPNHSTVQKAYLELVLKG